MAGLTAMKWYGGKADRHGWIRRHLPNAHRRQMYVEPFAGMLSVLLNRPAAGLEIISDMNDRVVNWWKAVREQPEELERLLQSTPWSRSLFKESTGMMDDGDSLHRAWRFTICITQSMMCSDGSGNGARDKESEWHWHDRLGGCSDNDIMRRPGHLRRLADRMRNVQIDCDDGVGMIRRAARRASRNVRGIDVLIYADPPYAGTDVSPYSAECDFDALRDALVDAAEAGAKVSVSGYPGNFDLPGWRMETKADKVGITKSARTEALWMSYPPETPSLFAV